MQQIIFSTQSWFTIARYENLGIRAFDVFVHFTVFNLRNPYILQGLRGQCVFCADLLKERVLQIFIKPGQQKPKVNINGGFILVNIYDIDECECEVYWQFFFNSIVNVDRLETSPVKSRKDYQTAVLLIRLVLYSQQCTSFTVL